MKFILHEVKLWFKNEDSEPKSYYFLPNKINVITGDATTGKTSFWSIIDYCLMSGKMNIANTIIEKVDWFGIRFTINEKEISIARKSPTRRVISSEVYLNNGLLPAMPVGNTEISEIKAKLDEEFGITENLRFPFGKELGKTTFNLTYRYFLLFNSLTEDIIGTSKTYFDTTFYGKDKYEDALHHIFDMVIGVNDMENLKALEKIQQIDKEIKKIQNIKISNSILEKKFENEIFKLVDKLKVNRFIDYALYIDSVDDAITIIDEVIALTTTAADNTKLFSEIDSLNKQKLEIRSQILAIDRYRREFKAYKQNLEKSADSLKPVEFLNNNLADQLIDSYETKVFIESLEESLRVIKYNLSKKIIEPLKVSGDAKKLNLELQQLDIKINELNLLKQNFQTEGAKFIVLGEVKNAREQLFKSNVLKPIDTIKLNQLNDERYNFEKNLKDIKQDKFVMLTSLNDCIQRNYNQLSSLPAYKGSKTIFNESEMILQLQPIGELFPLETVGSKSNYMFMHLCFYLGLHEHMISVGQEHVPEFLFIDQPSIPYYSGSNMLGNNDRLKLLDAFSLLNSFIDFITQQKGNNFQIFMVEHAPKEYWTENNLTYFHTVDEFIDGKGLIPNEIYNT